MLLYFSIKAQKKKKIITQSCNSKNLQLCYSTIINLWWYCSNVLNINTIFYFLSFLSLFLFLFFFSLFISLNNQANDLFSLFQTLLVTLSLCGSQRQVWGGRWQLGGSEDGGGNQTCLSLLYHLDPHPYIWSCEYLLYFWLFVGGYLVVGVLVVGIGGGGCLMVVGLVVVDICNLVMVMDNWQWWWWVFNGGCFLVVGIGGDGCLMVVGICNLVMVVNWWVYAKYFFWFFFFFFTSNFGSFWFGYVAVFVPCVCSCDVLCCWVSRRE